MEAPRAFQSARCNWAVRRARVWARGAAGTPVNNGPAHLCPAPDPVAALAGETGDPKTEEAELGGGAGVALWNERTAKSRDASIPPPGPPGRRPVVIFGETRPVKRVSGRRRPITLAGLVSGPETSRHRFPPGCASRRWPRRGGSSPRARHKAQTLPRPGNSVH